LFDFVHVGAEWSNDVAKWSSNDVANWVKNVVKLKKSDLAILINNHVNGRMLLNLTTSKLTSPPFGLRSSSAFDLIEKIKKLPIGKLLKIMYYLLDYIFEIILI
jgi:hypothetical protein